MEAHEEIQLQTYKGAIMKSRLIVAAGIASILFGAAGSVLSADSSGSVYGKVYADWYYNASDDDAITKKSEVEVTRVYLGYKYTIDEHFAANALLDVERANPAKTVMLDTNTNTLTSASDTRYFAYLKTASLDWKGLFPYMTLSVGQLGYFAFNVQEKFWGKRYLYKSFMDQQGWESSADLGATVGIAPNDMVKITAGVVNGEGYKAPQDKYGNYKTGLGLQVNPISDLTLYAYGDWMPVGETTDNAQSTAAVFAGYTFQKLFNLGAEYAVQMNQKGVADHTVNGLSVYGMVPIVKQLDLFARFDMASSQDDFNTSNDGQTVIGGVQYSPVKNVKIAANYQRFMPKPDNITATDKVSLNGEFDY
jgi:opacity protein-like surface antigen